MEATSEAVVTPPWRGDPTKTSVRDSIVWRAMYLFERYRRWRRDRSRLVGGTVVLAFLGLGFAVFHLELKECESVEALDEFAALNLSAPLPSLTYIYSVEDDDCYEELTFIDTLYLTIVTISTVGYGDFSPRTTPMRIFTVLYIIVGSSYIFVQLSHIFVIALEIYRNGVLTIIDKLWDRTPTLVKVDSTGDGKLNAELSVSGRSKGVSGRGVDISGDGQIDFIEPPPWVAFWTQELVPALALWLGLQLLFSLFFHLSQPDIDFGTAFYHCLITATTVGYGDVSLETQLARLLASAHILISVSWLAALFGVIDRRGNVRKAQLERAVLLTKTFDREQIMSLDANGDGIDKLEFVIGMLRLLGVELCGQPLRWHDVRPFVQRFDELDVSKTGTISTDDLDNFYAMEERRHSKLMSKLGWNDSTVAMTQSYNDHRHASLLKQASIEHEDSLYKSRGETSTGTKAIDEFKLVKQTSAGVSAPAAQKELAEAEVGAAEDAAPPTVHPSWHRWTRGVAVSVESHV